MARCVQSADLDAVAERKGGIVRGGFGDFFAVFAADYGDFVLFQLGSGVSLVTSGLYCFGRGDLLFRRFRRHDRGGCGCTIRGIEAMEREDYATGVCSL